MQNAQPNLFTRPDTFFGVCQGLGEDLGIHPNFLRLALAGLLFWNPPAAVAAYAGAGALVLLTRLLFPNNVPAPEVQAPVGTQAAAADEPLQANDQADAERVPLAA